MYFQLFISVLNKMFIDIFFQEHLYLCDTAIEKECQASVTHDSFTIVQL